jgi:hypothetical protein
MKRLLIIVLTWLLIVAVTGTVFAGPFADVPAKHWAYDAVNSLAKAGIVDGYSDDSFKGDRTITRYEMAQIVAKAMEHEEKADAQQKVLINKLATEFADELKSLGVRVSKLEEKNQVKIAGDYNFRYVADNPGEAFKKYQISGNDHFQSRFRLFVTGDINDNTTILARVNSQQVKFGYGTNDTYHTGYAISQPTLTVDWFMVTTKDALGFNKIRVGRQWAQGPGYEAFVGNECLQDGLYLEKRLGDQVTWKGSAYATGTSLAGLPGNKSYNLKSTALFVKPNKEFEYNVGYWWSNEPGLNLMVTADPVNGARNYTSNQGLVIAFNKDFGTGLNLIGEYTATTLNGAQNLPSSPKGYMFQLSSRHQYVFYSAQMLLNAQKQPAGSDAWAVSYRSIDAGAAAASQNPVVTTSYSNSFFSPYNVYTRCDNVNVLMLLYQKVVQKNLLLTLEYQDYKVKNLRLTNLNSKELDKTYKAQVTWYWN